MAREFEDLPKMLYVPEGTARVVEHSFYRMAVFDGVNVRPPRPEEIIPLPEGSDLFLLPGRRPVGLNPETGGPEVLGGALAAAGFAAPAYLRLAHPAFYREEDAPLLPMFAYAAVGWYRGRIVSTAVRVDRSRRQDPRRFDLKEIRKKARALVRSRPKNRLIAHLEHCALVYGCRAAQNFFLGREECPLPVARSCNATCVGCLSYQPPGSFPSSHERIAFTPTPDEIAEVALIHIGRVARPVVSFGQGCEGEPLTAADVLLEAIREIRKKTKRGTINLNTNGSRPDVIQALCEAGLDSIRLTINSFRQDLYDAYFRPRGYSLSDVLSSGKIMRASGGFVSVNLLVFPGVSDQETEIETTVQGLEEIGAELVQLRNLNIDPDVYLEVMGRPEKRPLGLLEMMRRLRASLPGLKFGYFNPPVRTLVAKRRLRLARDFA